MVGMSSCSKCPAGYECEDQTEVGSVCGTGEYSLAGELHCNTCPAGSYCPQVYSQPLGCSAGWYSAPGSTVCTECDAGFSCSNPAAVPKQCEDGTMSEDGATFCVGCPAGQICTGGTPTECADDELPNQDGSACVVSKPKLLINTCFCYSNVRLVSPVPVSLGREWQSAHQGTTQLSE